MALFVNITLAIYAGHMFLSIGQITTRAAWPDAAIIKNGTVTYKLVSIVKGRDRERLLASFKKGKFQCVATGNANITRVFVEQSQLMRARAAVASLHLPVYRVSKKEARR